MNTKVILGTLNEVKAGDLILSHSDSSLFFLVLKDSWKLSLDDRWHETEVFICKSCRIDDYFPLLNSDLLILRVSDNETF